ncbi:ankyrin repeat-containing domain protein [Dunaliella salina]|uniref:Ankyrin repeat-containing domain protein n=1 Tax=Dunaliella salina TaxID=3046 RepID=A0ABQ7GHV0_DUNSA|nr:ankyrin repeat-containing domain protein [Dunaliella salina]|eukprot:KAF5834183.1 ankyrin repeat-containing domain protein [Dunaliella salina]
MRIYCTSAVLCQDPKPMIFRLLEAYGHVDGGSRAEAALASLEAEAKASEQAEAVTAEANLQALCDRWAALEAEATDKNTNAQQLLDLQLEQQQLMQQQQVVWLSIWGRVHYAAHHGHNKMLEELLRKGCPADEPDEFNMTPILKASRGGYADCIVTLLNAKADIRHRVPETQATCILLASAGTAARHAAAVGVLLAHGANIEDRDTKGNTPLLAACRSGNGAVVARLLTCNVELDAVNLDLDSGLHLAARLGSAGHDCVRELLEHQATQDLRNASGETPFVSALLAGHTDTAAILKEHGSNPHFQLHWAVENPHANPKPNGVEIPSLTKQILGQAPINLRDTTGMTALHAAARAGNDPAVLQLLESKANPNIAAHDGSTALIAACENGHTASCKLLLSCDAHIGAFNAAHRTALHCAARRGHAAVVKQLLQAIMSLPDGCIKSSVPDDQQAKEDAKTMSDATITATLTGNLLGKLKSLKRFEGSGRQEPQQHPLLRSALLNAQDRSGTTAVMLAAKYGCLSTVEQLIKAQADVHITNYRGWSALHHASYHGWLEISRVLIAEAGAPIDQATLNGETPLHFAANQNQMDVLKLLLLNEADIFAGTAYGQPALTKAAENGHCEVIEHLTSRGARLEDQDVADTVGLNGLDGCCLTGAYSTIKQYTQKFGKGDTIGLVYNPAFQTLSYTRNGVHLGTAAKRLAPGKQSLMIGFGEPGIKLEANFFEASDCKYDKLFEAGFDELLMEEEHIQNPGNLAHPWKVKDRICPLHMAASSKSISSLKLLLDLGAVVDQRDADGWTAMHYAAIVGWDEGAKLLLERGADPNAVSLFDSTPILMSVKSSHAGVTRVLLENGAKLRCSEDERDRKGRTLLMWAANTGNSTIMQMLLERDVSIRAKDKLGRTALQYACNEQVVTYLENALSEMDTFRGVFLIGKQQDITEGSAGKVIMAMHQGTNNKVAIKFYRDRPMRDATASMLRELMPAHRFIAALPRDMDPAEVVFEDTDNRVPGCPYALVVEGGGEDLSELMARTGSTPMPENQIRYTFECVATAVNVLHSLGRVHHDLKSGNLVRFFDGSYRLVDMDNCRIAGVENHGMTSLEICPPEMARPLLFKTPQELKSDFAADMWALGCILYEMVTHTQFLTKLKREWEGRRVDNTMLFEGLDLLANLQQSQVDQVIDTLQERKRGRMLVELTSDLMRMLLKVDPRDRCTSEDVLWHSFLKGGTTATQDERNLTGVRNTLNVVHDKVDKVLLATTDIHERTVSIQMLSEETRDSIATCARRISGLRALVMEVATRSEYPSTFSVGPDMNFKELLRPEAEKNAALGKWLSTLKEVMTGEKTMADTVKQLVGVKNLRLALLCERCMEPQTSYKIEENPPLVANLLPAFQVGLQMVKLYNLGACAGRFFFPALPAVPSELVARSQEFVNSMGFKSSAQDFNCIQETLDKRQRDKDKGAQSGETVGGQQLGVSYRELGNFLDKHDAGRDWGGLMVVETEEEEASSHAVDPKGGVLWVCKSCMTSARGLSRETTLKASPVSEASIRKPSTEHQSRQQSTKQPASPAKSLKSGLCGLSLGSSKVVPD